jgi:photosystem II stability/assembly factor-like uncharacterized protein
MTPEERELRRALDARSEETSPEFRARLSSALAEGRPTSNFLLVLAAVAAVVLVFATVGVLLLARQARNEPPPVAVATPSANVTPSPTQTPTPTPTSSVIAGVLAKPAIALPTDAQLSAPSTNVIWVLMQSEYLFRSIDKGAHWEQRPTLPLFHGGVQTLEMSFVNDHEGWMTVGGPTAATSACAAYRINLWHTTDAGTTWQLLPAKGIALSRCKDGLSFVDSNRGFLDAWDQQHAPVIYRTLNGGLTWAVSPPLPDPPGFKTHSNSTIQPGVVRAFGSTLLVPATGQAFSGNGFQDVYRSNDGGASWAFVTATSPYGQLALVTASRWIQLLPPSSARETTNGGASWHQYRTDYTQAAPIAPQVVFADSEVGYATARGSIARTLDGGLHWSWTAVKSPGT